ncbi:rubredoxin [Candidatus Woesearchaeota archaeon]|nr:rubredoxin [Candidatus Woesearchaeota archaeon]
MSKYICMVCGFVYNELQNNPLFEQGTPWLFKTLPKNWTCPMCGVPKKHFEILDEKFNTKLR